MKYNDSVISLFSGAGGMSLGFSEAGFKPTIAVDINKDACATYEANLGNSSYCIDLANFDERFSSELSIKRGAFALVGGPPCQGFSSAGLKNGSDTRNQLIFNYFRIVETVRPRWFLLENVEGLLTSNRGESVADLVKQFISIGYRVRLEKINFASYGLPQARKRVLLIGNLLELDFQLPCATHSYNAGKHFSHSELPPAPTIMEALAGLGRPAAKNSIEVQYESAALTAYDKAMRAGNTSGSFDQHAAEKLSASLKEIAAVLRQGQTMGDLPEAMWHESFKRRANRRVMDGTPTEKRGGAPSGLKRLSENLNSLTITSAATREFLHPIDDRSLTLREAARLQSFPDKFKFSGGANSVAKQIGNAFPPLCSYILAKHMATIDGRAGADVGVGGQAGKLLNFHLTDAAGMSPALSNTARLLQAISTEQNSFPNLAPFKRKLVNGS